MKVKSHWALLITHIETIGRCYLLESLRYTSLLLYDVTPVSQRKHNILIPILDWEIYHTFIGTINKRRGREKRYTSPCQWKNNAA